MFVVYEVSNAVFAKNLDSVNTFGIVGNEIQDYTVSTVLFAANSPEEVLVRFNDIIDAANDDQNVYDTRKEVGYWKAKKPGPKPKPKAPAQGNQEPAPKK